MFIVLYYNLEMSLDNIYIGICWLSDFLLNVLNFFFFFGSGKLNELQDLINQWDLFFINLQTLSLDEGATLLTLCSGIAITNGLFYFMVNNKTFLHSLMYAEVCYLGIILKLVELTLESGLLEGQIYALIMVTLAAAESAVGLGVTICIFRLFNALDLNSFSIIKS